MKLIPNARGLLVIASLLGAMLMVACTGAEGPQGPAGPPGPQGPAGPAGESAPTSAAGISLDKTSYVIGEERTFTVNGWGFSPGEAVVITLHTDAYGPGIIGGVDANEFGVFAYTPGGRFRMDRIESSPGMYTVLAEGDQGSKTSAPIVFVSE